MYLSFYKLDIPPFKITSDPMFLWLGTKHREGLDVLEDGLRDNAGILVLTGDIGTGKTTLVNMLLNTLEDDTLVAVLHDSNFEPLDFYNYLSHAFKLSKDVACKRDFLALFEQFLQKSFEANKRVLLIIDEAQRINQKLLENILLLIKIQHNGRRLISIIFVGQLEFNDILRRPENRTIHKWIGVKYIIPRLSEFETGQYIKHRLIVAGAEEEIYTLVPIGGDIKKGYVDHILVPPQNYIEIFTKKAIKQIYLYSQGYPRLINIICDRCLFTGCAEGSKTITAEIVMACKKKLTIQLAKSSMKEAGIFLRVPKQNTASLPGKLPAHGRRNAHKDDLTSQDTSHQKTFLPRKNKPPSN